MKYSILIQIIFLIYPILSKFPNDFIFTEEEAINNLSLKLSIQEIIFTEYEILPIIILLFGCFITLYGAAYNFFLIVKFTLFFYYIISIFMSYDENIIRRNLLFVLLFCFISAVLLYIGYKSNIKYFEKHIFIKQIFLGAITGCFLNQIIFHFLQTFTFEYEQKYYYTLFPILIISFALINFFLPKIISFIPCSVISGLFFIQLSIDSLYGINLTKAEKILDTIFFVIFAALAFLYQLYHLKRKKNEIPRSAHSVKTYIRKNLDVTQDSNDSSLYNPKEMEDRDSNANNKGSEGTDETQDNQIDDQE